MRWHKIIAGRAHLACDEHEPKIIDEVVDRVLDDLATEDEIAERLSLNANGWDCP